MNLFFPSFSKMHTKYRLALRNNPDLLAVYRLGSWDDYIHKFPALNCLGRVASYQHICSMPSDAQDFADFIKEFGYKNMKDFWTKVPIAERALFRKKYRKKFPLELTEWGKFVRRRRKHIMKDFPMLDILVKEIIDLDNKILKITADIKKGNIYQEIDWFDLLTQRDRIQNIEELYYDCIRQWEENKIDPSICSGDLIGNDGSVSYATLWGVSEGLWQILDFYGIVPHKVLQGKGRWFSYGKDHLPRWWLSELPLKEHMDFDDACFLEDEPTEKALRLL